MATVLWNGFGPVSWGESEVIKGTTLDTVRRPTHMRAGVDPLFRSRKKVKRV